MHHAKKTYRTASRRQRRQIQGRNVIPSLSMKHLREKTSWEADEERNTPELGHGSRESGGPVDEGEGFRTGLRSSEIPPHAPRFLVDTDD